MEHNNRKPNHGKNDKQLDSKELAKLTHKAQVAKAESYKENQHCKFGNSCKNHDCKFHHSKIRRLNLKPNQFKTAGDALANVVAGIYEKQDMMLRLKSFADKSIIIESLHWTDQVKTFKDEDLKFFKSRRNAIIRSVYGTLEPKLRLKSTFLPESLTTGVLSADVVPCEWAGTPGIIENNIWASLFDEVRFLGEFTFFWVPYSVVGTVNASVSASSVLPIFIGVIDYDSSGSLAGVSIDNCLAYDTSKIFNLCTTQVDKCEHASISWKGHVQGIPDTQWVSTAANSTVAYLKLKNMSGYAQSIAALGVVLYKANLEFRQMN